MPRGIQAGGPEARAGSFARVLARSLGLRRGFVGLLGMVVLVGMGERMAERFLPIYLVALGGGPLAVGLLNGLQNLLNAVYSYPGGWLAERAGAKRALLVFNLVAMAGYLIAMAAPAWPVVIAASVLFLSWSALSLPATMELVARVLPAAQRTMGVSMHSLVRRVPMALGPLAGGALIGAWGEITGVRLAFAAAFAMALLAIAVQQRAIDDDAPLAGGARPPAHPVALWRAFTPGLRGLLASDILIRFCEQIPYAFVVLWCMRGIARPVTAFEFGVLTAIEMATAVVCYVPVATLADRGEKRPFVLVTFVFFTLFPAALYFAQSFAWLVPVFVLRGLKEFGEPTRKALILDLAPGNRHAAAFGLYYLIRDVIVSIAAFGGALLWQQSPAVNFGAAFVCGAAGTLWFAVRRPAGSPT
jgi:MFS family permease